MSMGPLMSRPPTQPEAGNQAISSATSLQERLSELEVELERAGRLATLGMMAGAVAHEFNNLLTPVLSYAQLALNDLDDRELVEKALMRCVEGAEKAAAISSSMLGLVRPDDSAQRSDIADVVDHAIKSLSRHPRKDGIELVIDAPEDMCAGIRPIALEQIVLNLVINARSAIMPDPGTIRVSCKRSTWNKVASKLRTGSASTAVPSFSAFSRSTSPESAPVDHQSNESCVVLQIMDTGRGIEPKVASRLFRPLETHSGTDADGRTGTGLGLMICKRLIEEAGGAIGFKTAPGVGTSFTIALPALSPEETPTKE